MATESAVKMELNGSLEKKETWNLLLKNLASSESLP